MVQTIYNMIKIITIMDQLQMGNIRCNKGFNQLLEVHYVQSTYELKNVFTSKIN